MMKEEDRVIQIMTAPEGMQIVYMEGVEEFKVKVGCLALTVGGQIKLVEVTDDGEMHVVDTNYAGYPGTDFQGIEWDTK